MKKIIVLIGLLTNFTLSAVQRVNQDKDCTKNDMSYESSRAKNIFSCVIYCGLLFSNHGLISAALWNSGNYIHTLCPSLEILLKSYAVIRFLIPPMALVYSMIKRPTGDCPQAIPYMFMHFPDVGFLCVITDTKNKLFSSLTHKNSQKNRVKENQVPSQIDKEFEIIVSASPE